MKALFINITNAYLLLITSSLFAQTNDNFVNALPLTAGMTVSGNNTTASKELGEPDYNSSQATLWWNWTAPAGISRATLITQGSSFDTTLGLFTGLTVSGLTIIATNDDGGPNNSSALSFIPVAGTIYRIAVGGYSSNRGNISLTLSQFAKPTNDDFASPALLTTGVIATGNTSGATSESGEPSPFFTNGPSLWWSWIAPAGGGVYQLSTAGSSVNTGIGLYVGTALNALTTIDTDNRSSGNGGDSLVFLAQGGVTYRMAVSSSDTARGAVSLSIASVTPPGNDNFANATPLIAGIAATSVNNTNATLETGEPSPVTGMKGSVWWKWTAPAGVTSAAVSSAGSNFQNVVSVFTGTGVSGLTLLGTNSFFGTSNTSLVTFSVQVGQVYYISVASQQSTQRGTIALKLSSAPLNDRFTTPATLTTGVTATGESFAATREVGEPASSSSYEASLWYAWTAPTGGGVFEISNDGSAINTVLGIYKGNALGSMTMVEEDNRSSSSGGEDRIVFRAEGGVTYRIAVYSFGSVRGAIAVTINQVPAVVNDLFASALPLATGVTNSGINNSYATREDGEPTPFSNTKGSVWWKWTSPAVSIAATVNTNGSNFDTLLGLYTGPSISSLTQLATNDDGGDGLASQITFTTQPNTTYYFLVAGYNYLRGNVAITVSGAPNNDAFASALTLPTGTTVTAYNSYATTESNEPLALSSSQATLWWNWSPSVTGVYEITTDGSNYDTTLGVWTGTSLTALISIGRDDDSGSGLTSRLLVRATAGTTYRISVGGYGSDRGTISLRSIIITAPTNDDFANAFTIFTGGTATAVSNAFATLEPSEVVAPATAQGTLWWNWTAQASGQFLISTAGSNFDTSLGVFEGNSVSSLTPRASNDNGGNGLTSQLVISATAGTTYRIAVGGTGESRGLVALAVSPAVTNDSFANAVSLTSNTTTTGSNRFGTTEGGEPLATPYTRGTSWWNWTAPAGGGLFEVSTEGSTFDTTLGVWTGTAFANLALVASDDNSAINSTSRLVFNATGGTVYRIAVGGHAGASGSISLIIRALTRPTNDDFVNAATLVPGAPQTAAILNATLQTGEPILVPPSSATLWWKWTPTASGNASLALSARTFDPTMSVFTGTTLSNLTPVTSNDEGISRGDSVLFSATVGTTYYISVGSYSGSRGTAQLTLNYQAGASITRNWDGGGDGLTWGDPLNWSGDVLPGPLDDVVINVPGITVNIRITEGFVSVRNFNCAENLSIIASGNLRVRGVMTVFGTLTVAPGRILTAFGSSAVISSSGLVFIDGACLFAIGGGKITLNAASYSRTQAGVAYLIARGAGSELNLPSLATFTGRSTAGDNTYIQAQAGGIIQLNACTQVLGGAIQFIVDGINSRLSLPQLYSFVGYLGQTDSGFTASNGGTIAFGVNQVQINVAIILVASGGIIQGSSIHVLENAILCGSGRVIASIVNGGIIRPGDGAALTAILTIEGGFTQLGSGRVEIDISGTFAGSQYDVISVTGLFVSGGSVSAILINGYFPSLNTVFLPITRPGGTGEFPGFTGLDLGGGQEFRISYIGTGLQFTTGLRTGPRVLTATPFGAQQIVLREFLVTFDKPIDPQWFTTSKVTLTGTLGLINITSVIRVSGQSFRILCTPQIVSGNYVLRIGPDIRDYAGSPMNQTENGSKSGEDDDYFELTVNLTTPNLPNLLVSNVSGPVTAIPGQTVTVQWTVTNQGVGSVPAARTDCIFLSPDDFAGNDVPIASSAVTGLLAPGQSQQLSQSFVVPFNNISGPVSFVVQADVTDDVLEQSETDNYAIAGMIVTVPQTLAISSETSILREGSVSNSATTFTVTRNGSIANALTVSLSASPTGQLTFPATFAIPAGQSSVTVIISVIDDTIVEATQSITVSCQATGFTQAAVTLNVTDNDLVSANVTPLNYIEDSGWIQIFPNAVAASGGASVFGGGSVDVFLFNAVEGEDQLGFPTPLPAPWAISDTGVLNIGGVTVALLRESSPTALRLDLASNVLPSQIEALLRSISFINTSQNPVVIGRTCRLAITSGTLTTVVNRVINVLPVNDAPVIVDYGHETLVNTQVRLSHLLEDDFDYENDPFTLSLPNPTTMGGGTISLSGSSLVTYTPPPGFTGTDSFAYLLTDNQGATRQAQLQMKVWALSSSLSPLIGTVEKLQPGLRVRFYDIPDTDFLMQSSSDLQSWDASIEIRPDGNGTVSVTKSLWREKRFFRLRKK